MADTLHLLCCADVHAAAVPHCGMQACVSIVGRLPSPTGAVSNPLKCSHYAYPHNTLPRPRQATTRRRATLRRA